MELLYTIAITLATLAILVAVHEYGHFWVARRCGVKVLRFSIGFGTSLYSWQDRQGTQYSIAAIPLGGYVKMLDEREAEVPPAEVDRAFNRKPVLQRIAVVSAGPLANLALAVVAYWFLFMAGESGYAPVIGAVEAGSVADVAGLESGQEIVAVDGAATPTWQALSFRLLDRIGDTGIIRFAVKYPDSDVVYESGAAVQQWLADQEQPDLFGGLGIAMYTPEVPPVVSQVVADSPAQAVGLREGDRILRADGVTMSRWMDWVDYVRARPARRAARPGLRPVAGAGGRCRGRRCGSSRPQNWSTPRHPEAAATGCPGRQRAPRRCRRFRRGPSAPADRRRWRGPVPPVRWA